MTLLRRILKHLRLDTRMRVPLSARDEGKQPQGGNNRQLLDPTNPVATYQEACLHYRNMRQTAPHRSTIQKPHLPGPELLHKSTRLCNKDIRNHTIWLPSTHRMDPIRN